MISAELSAAQLELFSRRDQQGCASSQSTSSGWLSCLQSLPAKATIPAPVASKPQVDQLTVSPDIAMAILRQELSAAGRIWHLLRLLDVQGRGVLRIADVRRHLTEKGSELRSLGWRQLRNLLREGKGMFWDRDQTHVWLAGRSKLALRLGLSRLSLALVQVPTCNLVGGIKAYRAALYETFHAGRKIRPISRATLTDLSGVSASSQRSYEATGQIVRTAQFAIVGTERESEQPLLWRSGGHVFPICDKRGVGGRPNDALYLKQIPNCFTSDLTQVGTRIKNRLNRKMKDLLATGAVGNVQQRDTGQFKMRLYGIDRENIGHSIENVSIPTGHPNVWQAIMTAAI